MDNRIEISQGVMEGIMSVVGLVTIGFRTATELETMFTVSSRSLNLPSRDGKFSMHFFRGCTQLACAAGLLAETFIDGKASYTLPLKQNTEDAVQNTVAPKGVN